MPETLAKATDDASLIEAAGGVVRIFGWDEPNLKVTTRCRSGDRRSPASQSTEGLSRYERLSLPPILSLAGRPAAFRPASERCFALRRT